MRGTDTDRSPAHQPLFHHPDREWRASLAALAAAETPDAWIGHGLEFINPADGGAIMPTISAHVLLLPRGFETKLRRSTDGTVMVVIGQGHARVCAEELALLERGIVVVPSWDELMIQAGNDLLLFGFSHRTAQGVVLTAVVPALLASLAVFALRRHRVPAGTLTASATPAH